MAALSFEKPALNKAHTMRHLRHQIAVHPLLLLVCLILLAPVVAIAIVATGPTDDLMPHLLQTVLGRYVQNTILLMTGVGILAVMFGVSTAWLVSRYEFVGRRWFEWLLVLPAAMQLILLLIATLIFLNMLAQCKAIFVPFLAGKQRGITGFQKYVLLAARC